jgi:hypothetical protein
MGHVRPPEVWLSRVAFERKAGNTLKFVILPSCADRDQSQERSDPRGSLVSRGGELHGGTWTPSELRELSAVGRWTVEFGSGPPHIDFHAVKIQKRELKK